MSSIRQFQLLEFLALLWLCHIGIRNLVPNIDIPFLGITGTAALNAFLFAFCPVNKYVWTLVLIITLAAAGFLQLRNKRSETVATQKEKTISLTTVGWFVAVGITALFVACTLLLSPGRNQPGADRISTRDKLMTQAFQGEDSLTHINIIQAINKTGTSTYFDSTTQWNDYLIPTVSSYAQLSHSATSNVKVGVHDILAIGGQERADITSLLWAYVLSHFFFVGMAIGLAACVVMSVLRSIKNMNEKYRFIAALAMVLFALKVLSFPIISYGFYSQSAAMIGLLSLFLIESNATFQENKENRQIQRSVIRIIPLIIIGQTWWLLTPVAAAFLAMRIAPEFFQSLRKRKIKPLLAPFVILAAGSAFSLLPVYAQFFIYNWKVSDIANLPGGVQLIDINRIIVYCAVVATLILAYLISRMALKKSTRSIDWAAFFFVLSGLGALSVFAIYQQRNTHHYSYYTYKLAWSIVWIPFTALFIGVAICVFLTSKAISSFISFEKLKAFPLVACVCIAIALYMLVGIASTQTVKLTLSPNALQLADLSKAIEKAEQNNQIVIVMSDCGGLNDYIFQKAAGTLQGRWTQDSFYFNVALLTEKDKDSIRKELLEKNPKQYFFYDFTPTNDQSAPSDRIKVDGVAGMRTTLERPWSIEWLSSRCQPIETDAIS
ncbi:MAG TPA: hypothetical protein PKB15_05370 [Acidimicrobiia bacterium]|nr:hypothetical protein [Acidimicrobiia bacterium]